MAGWGDTPVMAAPGAQPGGRWGMAQRCRPATEDAALARSTLASSFVAALELTRTGQAEITQSSAFGPLLLRVKSAGSA